MLLCCYPARVALEPCRIFVSEIFRDLQRRAGFPTLRDDACGAVTGIQRFGGALNLNIHFHSLVLDGVYVVDPAAGTVRFQRLPSPTPSDLDQVLFRTRRRISRLLSKKGFHVGPDDAIGAGEAESVEIPSVLDALQGASIQGRLGLADSARRVTMVAENLEEAVELPETSACRKSGDGFNLEAGRCLRAGDRAGLEKLCRYVLRPPFAQERIERLPDGRVMYRFRRPWPDGSTHIVLEPVEFLGKLAALVPPPRSHLVRYHGILAPHARRRGVVTPRPTRVDGPTAPSAPANPAMPTPTTGETRG
ncbi:MAG: transposase, partial [candidate division NC10 bacterium]